MHPRTCECFSVCSNADIISFHNALPRITSHQSPWSLYLFLVYGKLPSLPFDMTQLEVFYPHLLPTLYQTCGGYNEFADGHKHAVPTPQCSPTECTRWHMNALSRKNGSGTHSIIRSIVRQSPDTLIDMSRVDPFSLFIVIQTPREFRRPAINHSWVEIVRVTPWQQRGCIEGTDYGCWFWTGRGSGIFVNVGQTAYGRDLPDIHRKGFANHDCGWARQLLRSGQDSLQVLSTHPFLHQGVKSWVGPTELVIATRTCMHNANRTLSACIPTLELRTGWNANIPCTCVHSKFPFYAQNTLHCTEQVHRWTQLNK